MTRPDWCPQDVWEKAKEIASSFYVEGDMFIHACAIARAILAERERCEDIATAELRNVGQLLSNPPKSSAAWDIRNAIRQGSTHANT